MYHNIIEVLPKKQAWAKSEPHEAARELSGILQLALTLYLG
jgi:hypothetical protein